MRIKLAGKNATLVLLNAKASSSTFFDALNIRRFLENQTMLQPSLTSTLHKRHHITLS